MALNNKSVMSVFADGTQIYDIVNAIQTESSQGYRDYIPLADADNVASLQHAFKTNQTLLNEFVHGLINKVSKTIMTKLMVRQVLEEFKRGSSEFGDTIEEVHVNLAKEHVFDSKLGESKVFEREVPDVQAFYHKITRKVFYKKTVSDAEVVRAFNSWEGVTALVVKIVDSLYNGNRSDEYKYMKLLIESAYASGAFHVVPVGDINTADGQKKLVEKAREYSLLVRDVNHYNPTGVDNTSDVDSQYIILPARTQAKLDVNILASAFNMSYADFMGHKVDINYFGNNDIYAVLIDRDFYVVFDNLFEVRSLNNPENLCTNYWLHIHQTLSYSPFNTAIAFVKEQTALITSLLLTPPVSVIGASGVTLKTSQNVADGMSPLKFGGTTGQRINIVYTSNSAHVTLTPSSDGETCVITPLATAQPGDLITITAKGTITKTDLSTEVFTATAQIQFSIDIALV